MKLLQELLQLNENAIPDKHAIPDNVELAIKKIDALARKIFPKYRKIGDIQRDIRQYVVDLYDPDVEKFKDAVADARITMEDHFALNFDPKSNFNQQFEDGLDEIYNEMLGEDIF